MDDVYMETLLFNELIYFIISLFGVVVYSIAGYYKYGVPKQERFDLFKLINTLIKGGLSSIVTSVVLYAPQGLSLIAIVVCFITGATVIAGIETFDDIAK
jgi:hypothetical protein